MTLLAKLRKHLQCSLQHLKSNFLFFSSWGKHIFNTEEVTITIYIFLLFCRVCQGTFSKVKI